MQQPSIFIIIHLLNYVQMTISTVNNLIRDNNTQQWGDIMVRYPVTAASLIATVDTYGEMQASQLESGNITTYNYDHISTY